MTKGAFAICFTTWEETLKLSSASPIRAFFCSEVGVVIERRQLSVHYSFFSRVLRDSTPRFVGPSVRPLVCPSVGPSVRHTLLFQRLWGFWLYRSCPNAPLTSNMAPAHPHATGVAVYPALFFLS